MYLPDTDTVIYSLKGNQEVIKNLRLHMEDPMKLSIITLMELYYGAHKTGDSFFNGRHHNYTTIEESKTCPPIGSAS